MLHWLKGWGKKRPTAFKRPPWVKEWADAEMEDRRWTPDLPQLEGKAYHWLFIPGELQKGHPFHHLLKGFEPRWERFFTQSKFMCLKTVAGAGSKLLPFDTDLKFMKAPEMLPLRGELYKIPATMFIPLDHYHSNGLFYFRREISVVTPYEGLAFKDRSVAQNLLGEVSRPKLKTVAHFRKKLFADPVVKHTMIAKDGDGFVEHKLERELNPDQQLMLAKELAQGNTINSNTVWRQGVLRVWAWMYHASPHYWEDHLTLTNYPPIRRFAADGLISRYYRFTDFEYKQDGDDAPF